MDGKTIDTASLNGKLSSGDFEVSAQVVGTEVRHSTPARLRVLGTSSGVTNDTHPHVLLLYTESVLQPGVSIDLPHMLGGFCTRMSHMSGNRASCRRALSLYCSVALPKSLSSV